MFPLAYEDPATGNISRGYREDGYFPEAVVNFLAFLGWNPGTEQEIFSLQELVKAFELDRVHKAGARFDPDKTRWFNHQYMQHYDDVELAQSFISITPKITDVDVEYISKVVGLLKERATFITDFWE